MALIKNDRFPLSDTVEVNFKNVADSFNRGHWKNFIPSNFDYDLGELQ